LPFQVSSDTYSNKSQMRQRFRQNWLANPPALCSIHQNEPGQTMTATQSNLFCQTLLRRPALDRAGSVRRWDTAGKRCPGGSSGAIVSRVCHSNHAVPGAICAAKLPSAIVQKGGYPDDAVGTNLAAILNGLRAGFGHV
jgi:hypothetical protein